MSIISAIKSFYGKYLYRYIYLAEIWKDHKKKIVRCNKSIRRIKYYIIRWNDEMHCGWTIWERVVLYGCIYAEDHRMIPVVDMQNCHSIYQGIEDIGNVNTWEEYYVQPGGTSLAEALASESYELGDGSQEWFNYIRIRKTRFKEDEFLREKYRKFIHYTAETEEKLKTNFDDLLNNAELSIKSRLLGICIRGTDYKQFHHMKQPSVDTIVRLSKTIEKQYRIDAFFIATEDNTLFNSLTTELKSKKVVSYHAGEISEESKGYIGEYISNRKSPKQASLDYLTVLYALNNCVCLIGGLCGATIVAKYKREYEYINILDLKESY